MDSSVKYEIDSCITELRSIAAQLEDAADEVQSSISGMNTGKYTNALYECAKKYRSAAGKLSTIK